MGNVSKGIQHYTVSNSKISSCFSQNVQNRWCVKGNFFSSKNEILLKLRHLTLNDVEKVFKKVKEALEVSQHVFNY